MKHFDGTPAAPRILYAGDDDLDRAAQYLGSIIGEQGYTFDYIASPLRFPDGVRLSTYNLLILSDYPSARFSNTQLNNIAQYVLEGGSLLMVGGWESFSGLQKEYNQTPLADILPVRMKPGDDRRNVSQGCVVLPHGADHPIVRALRWDLPAIIGGYNAVMPKGGATTSIVGRLLAITAKGKRISAAVHQREVPLLVHWKVGRGMCTALAFDLAPHWVGGFVDWGKKRVRVDFNGAFIEVGNYYHRFVTTLLSFCSRKDS
ncbi:MAG: glutamine amidotransferase [Ignavibacteriales bacterium]|nr:glutamine amidotransferase [Ignavibacteriales bacterium]